MSSLKSHRRHRAPLFQPKAKVAKKVFEPRPCGELDCDALADEVMRKYPRILHRLGE